VVVVEGDVVISPMKVCSHIASFVACMAKMYLASVIDNAMMGCFFRAPHDYSPSQEEGIA